MKAIVERLRRSGLEALHTKVREGRRLDFDDGMRLYRTSDLTAVGYLANLSRERQNGDRTYFVPNLHINYTNICSKFCSFYAAPDNLPNIQSSWLTQGPKLGQIALQYGVNDGSTILEENVVSKESVFMVPLPEIERLTTDADFAPARRNTAYEILPPPSAPATYSAG
jgi:2-iminoacetate synthase ThiH